MFDLKLYSLTLILIPKYSYIKKKHFKIIMLMLSDHAFTLKFKII